MNWFFAAYLIALAFLTAQKSVGLRRNSLVSAWSWLAMLAISHFVFALFRAGNSRDPRDMLLIEIWANGFEWLFLGISMFCLASALKKGRVDSPKP